MQKLANSACTRYNKAESRCIFVKKAVNWAMYTGSIGFMLNGIIGIVKLLHGNNKVAMQAHLAVVFFVIAAVGIICKILLNRCPNCRKSVMTRGEYCPYCGEKIKKAMSCWTAQFCGTSGSKAENRQFRPQTGRMKRGKRCAFIKRQLIGCRRLHLSRSWWICASLPGNGCRAIAKG